jgi:hypothetical protein
VIEGDGGLPLLSYELQMGSLTLNDFTTIAGGEQYTLQIYFVVTKGITKGEQYAFRYRGVNAVGAGEWSEIVVLRAATVPEPPI